MTEGWPTASLTGLLLTGGASRRLGVDKATLVLDGETLAARAARLLAARCDRVLEVGPGVSGMPSIREVPQGSGPLFALAAGATELAADGGLGSVLLLACDLPWVAPALDVLMVTAGHELVIPLDADGRRQYVCARYGPAALVHAIALAAAGEQSLRALVAAGPAESVTELRGFAPGVFADIDLPEDAQRAGIDLHR